MPSSKLFRQAILSQFLVVAPGVATARVGVDAAESAPVRKHKRPSCATSNKFSKARLQQQKELVPTPAAAPSAPSGSSKSHIIRSVSKLFGRSRGEPVPEPPRGRSRQRRVVSGDDSERRRALSPPRVSSTNAKVPRVPQVLKASAHAPAYKPVRSHPFATTEAAQVPKFPVPVPVRRVSNVAESTSVNSLIAPTIKRGPSPLSQSCWTSPAESIPRSPSIPDGMPVDAISSSEPTNDSAMDWEPIPPVPPFMSRTDSSSTASSLGSVPSTPIDEDVVMVDVFDVESSVDVDALPVVEEVPAKSDDCSPPARPVKPLPARRHHRAPVEVPMPPGFPTDGDAGTLVASDSELERQLWADMNDILGHEDEPARFCFPPEGIPVIVSLPPSVPQPIIAKSIPAVFSNGVTSTSPCGKRSARTRRSRSHSRRWRRRPPDVVVTPATPVVIFPAITAAEGSDGTSHQSLNALWEELFGPEVDA
ncbi:hypothetical protein EVJ58_g3812 [Rhodofomes roseus]|uniref:Uncharacterized protein n=1 Tax=Rhodofomes roseus TaxID=34475 RepID=A0A4Y9YND5_9APHY|nr:hypothetical protein EVJ58_g3812 [Rhodofomes roseus]